MAPLEPEAAFTFALTAGVGMLMVLAGVQKSMLGWRRRRVCPGCRRAPERGRCGCS